MLVESLPIRSDSPTWAEFAAQLLGRGDGCPSMVALIELAAGRLPAEQAGEVRDHVGSCSYCGSWYRGYTRPLADEPMSASLRLLREQTVAAPPAPAEQPVAAPVEVPRLLTTRDRPALEASRSLADTFMRASDAEAIDELRPFLGELLADIGLAPELAESLGGFLDRRLQAAAQFPASGLPGWLEEFAREELHLRSLPCRLGPGDWDRVFERSALRYLALNPSKEGKSLHGSEAESARRFYYLVLDNPEPTWLDDQKLRALAQEAGVHLVDARRLLLGEGRKYSKTLNRRFGAKQTA
jgi:hypothetical protein